MKTNSRFRAKGFTLIELLIVITIIAILATIGLKIGGSAIEKAKRTQATTTCKDIETAVGNFLNDYNRLPKVGTQITDKDIPSNLNIINILQGMDTAEAKTANPRREKYLDVKVGRSNPVMNGVDKDNNLFDPFGNMYHMVMDYDGNEELKNPDEGGQSGEANIPPILRKKVLIWSEGPEVVAKTAHTPDKKTLRKSCVTWR